MIVLQRGILLEYLKQCGVVNPDLTLHRRFRVRLNRYPSLIESILHNTKFLRYSAPLKVRLHCIIQGVSTQPTCKQCGNPTKMRTTGREIYTFPKYCGLSCAIHDPIIKQKRIDTKRSLSRDG